MNIAKNMEAIFVVAIALVGVTSFATASSPVPAAPAPVVAAADSVPMHVVTVTAKRMTAAEKAASAQ
ncbi:hypothetical protein LP420_33240 [Massilia sp. B-10]|nr:hypothetical protein LP420_33240 [Massilia sp. B-10]UUZ53504.1 hypothetical protein LP419_32725 [Massilia sp. H-1]